MLKYIDKGKCFSSSSNIATKSDVPNLRNLRSMHGIAILLKNVQEIMKCTMLAFYTLYLIIGGEVLVVKIV